MNRDNPWIATALPPVLATRGSARRVAASTGARSGSPSQHAYDRLAERFHALFTTSDPWTFKSLWDALEAARAELAAGGSVSDVQSQRVVEWVARDLEYLAAVLVRGRRATAAELRALAAADTGALPRLLEALEASEDGIDRAATLARGPMLRRAGEVTCAGPLTCVSCGRSRRHRTSALLEPCGGCGKERFTRGI